MTFYIYSPAWFSGIDSLIEVITIITSILISIYSYRTYKYFKITKYKYFSLTFLLLAISFLSKIISNLMFVVPIKREVNFHIYTVIYTTYQNLDYVEDISFFIHKATLMLALLTLFFIINKEDKIETIILMTIFALTLAYLINNYLLFNFFIIIMSIYLFMNNYMKDKNRRNNKISNLSYFFLGLIISYFCLFLAFIHTLFYFLAEIVLTITFSYMLISFIRIFKK